MVNDCVGAGTGGWGRRRSSRFVFTCSAWTRAGSATRRRPAAVSREERRNMVDWVVVSVVGVVGGDDGERGVQLCVPPRWQSVVWSANALLPPPWSACAQGGGGGGGRGGMTRPKGQGQRLVFACVHCAGGGGGGGGGRRGGLSNQSHRGGALFLRKAEEGRAPGHTHGPFPFNRRCRKAATRSSSCRQCLGAMWAEATGRERGNSADLTPRSPR